MTDYTDNTTPFSDPGRRLFRELVESSHELFWQIDANGIYRYLNPAWENLFGFTMSEMIGRSFSEFQPHDIALRDLAYMAEVMAQPSFHNYETVFLHKNGTKIYCNFSGKQVFGDDDQFLGMQGVGYDITLRKKTELELRESEERYQNLSEVSLLY